LTVQDDERERELVRLFNLAWDPGHQRSGVDAILWLAHRGRELAIEVEVKSTTKDTVSTARDVGMDHVRRWRRKLFVIGFYSRDARRPELQRCLCLTPLDMADWIDGIAVKVELDDRIAQRSRAALGLADLYAVCGERSAYPVSTARTILRQQWTAQRYADAADAVDEHGELALSPAAMLEVLRERALYIAKRGATLNNPHITSRHLARFFGTGREIDSDWAARIRAIAVDWLESSQG
jgi:hypothetical protein